MKKPIFESRSVYTEVNSMKALSKIIGLGIAFFQIGCGPIGSSNSEITLIQPDSIRAKVLMLSSEDIWVLHQNHFEIERKIYCQKELALTDVIRMHEMGLSSECIIAILEYTRSLFDLSSADVIRLQLEGVSYKVINFMIQT